MPEGEGSSDTKASNLLVKPRRAPLIPTSPAPGHFPFKGGWGREALEKEGGFFTFSGGGQFPREI